MFGAFVGAIKVRLAHRWLFQRSLKSNLHEYFLSQKRTTFAIISNSYIENDRCYLDMKMLLPLPGINHLIFSGDDLNNYALFTMKRIRISNYKHLKGEKYAALTKVKTNDVIDIDYVCNKHWIYDIDGKLNLIQQSHLRNNIATQLEKFNITSILTLFHQPKTILSQFGKINFLNQSDYFWVCKITKI